MVHSGSKGGKVDEELEKWFEKRPSHKIGSLFVIFVIELLADRCEYLPETLWVIGICLVIDKLVSQAVGRSIRVPVSYHPENLERWTLC